ncbi:MAG: pyridoxamine 5'-phosphate oxidase family protein [Actinobacteria bacterium]|nr:pyridoxamine 5'-phosphate oxidase family protein [Actinomycetota bacterium]
MMSWRQFREARPDLADAGQRLLYQYGVGLAFLASVRRDGGPRVHPMCPLLTPEGLFAFLVPSPKRDDLHRDGRYALHCFPVEDNEDAFYVTGTARPIHNDELLLRRLETQFLDERKMKTRPPYFSEHHLFEFGIERCLLTSTTGHGDPSPKHVVWRGPAS